MNYRIFIILLLLINPFKTSVFSQNITISGIILDAYSIGCQDANIIISDKNQTIIAYTFSQANGFYSLSFPNSSNLELSVTHIGFKRVVVDISDFIIKDGIINKDFSLEESLQLPEIIIKPENIEPDTVSFDLNKYKLKEDDNLEAILKKNPNFNVGDDGSILYKGKSIDRILVNGKDFFTYQNSIALSKIENRMISQLQVVNNYRNSFSLDDDESEETVLNINSKEEFKNVITGSLIAGYGFKDKFDLQGSALKISSLYNLFLINSNNNIGRPTIELREIQNLFSNKQPFSTFQIESINELFRMEERKKDMISTTNLTIRKQTDKIKINGLFYYFKNNRENDIFSKNTDENGESLLIKDQDISYESNSFFSDITIDYLLKKNQILSYASNLIILKPTTSSHVVSTIKDTQLIPTTIETYSNDINDSYNLFNKIIYSNKINSHLFLFLGADSYYEKTKLKNSITEINDSSDIHIQSFKYEKNYINTNNTIQYKKNNAVNIYLEGSAMLSNESLLDQIAHIDNQRNSSKLNLNIIISGQKVMNKINYKLILGAEKQSVSFGKLKNDIYFIPYNLNFNYENRLNRLNISLYSSQNLNPVESGIEYLNNNNLILGNEKYPVKSYVKQREEIGYVYNNFFMGKRYGISISHQRYKDQLTEVFLDIDQYGIRKFILSAIPKTEEYKISGEASRLIFKYGRYPIKTDLGLSYRWNSAPIYFAETLYNITNNQVNGFMKFESITDKIINFETSLDLTSSINRVGSDSFNAKYFKSRFTIKLDYKKIRSEVAYILFNDYIIGKTYNRQNINLNISYKLKKATFLIEGENVDQFFSIFNNKAYNTKFSILNGINQTTVSNQAINYLIFKIKYNY